MCQDLLQLSWNFLFVADACFEFELRHVDYLLSIFYLKIYFIQHLCASLHRLRAPGTRSSQMFFIPVPGNHRPWVQQWKKQSRPWEATPPPPVFDISTRNHFAPLCETERDTVIVGDSIVWHVRAMLTEGKVLSFQLQPLRFTRGWTTPSCGRRRHWSGTLGAWSRWYAAHRSRRGSSWQDLFPRIDEDTKGSVDYLL